MARGEPIIAVLPGDGIGPEVTAEAVRVLARVRPDVSCHQATIGGAALRLGLPPLPDEARALCERSAAILFGSVGLPEYAGKPLEERPEFALYVLRRDFELFANIRPVKAYPGLESSSPLKAELLRGLDFVVVRELTGGIYFGTPKHRFVENGVECAVDTMTYRAPEIERIVRVGFELARSRRKRLTSVDKENILETSRLWRRVTTRVSLEFPDVQLEHLLVDTAAMRLVLQPSAFDVLVTENMFGDILSDEAAVVTGTIGTSASASLGGWTGGYRFGLYEPIGGTAPDIAGRGIANPTASILSVALMLRHSMNDEAGASRIEHAVEAAFANGARTADVAGHQTPLGTTAFTDTVLANL